MARARRAHVVAATVFLVALASVSADPPAYEDTLELADGKRLVGVITSEADDTLELQDGAVTRKLARTEIARITYREDVYLAHADASLAAAKLEEAIATLEQVATSPRKGPQDWQARARSTLERALVELACERYLDLVWVDGGRRLAGKVAVEDAAGIELVLPLGTVRYERARIVRILRKEEATLAKARALEDGRRVEDAIALYRKVALDPASPPAWRLQGACALALALVGLAEEARAADDLEQAQRLLARASELEVDVPTRARITAVAGAIELAKGQRAARASELEAEARALIAKQEYRAAYEKLAIAINLVPDKVALRALLDVCLAGSQVLAYGEFDEPETLDPLTADKPVEQRLGQLLYGGLVGRDEREEFVYELAKSVEPDATGTRYTFELRRGIKWSDGYELTASDVELTLKLLTNPGTHGHNPTFAQFIDRVEVTSPYTFAIVLRRPFYLPLSLFSFKIVPHRPFTREWLRRDDPFCRAPIGSGPFKYAGGLDKRAIELVRNDAFSAGTPAHLAGVRVVRYQDRQSARNDLERGELHLLPELRPLDVDFFDKQKGQFVVRQYRARTIYFLAFNFRNPLFGESGRELRLAIASAIDRQAILEQFFNAGNPLKQRGGQAHAVITGPYPYNSWAYNDAVAEYAYDPDYATQMLAESLKSKGYTRAGPPGAFGGRNYWTKGGVELELVLKYPLGDLNVEKAVIFIADAMKKMGLKVRLAQKAPRDLHEEVVVHHDFDLVYAGHSFDDTYDAYPLFDPRRMEAGGSNFSGYVNPHLVKLFAQMEETRNPRRLVALAREIHKTAHDDCAHAYLWQLDRYAGHTAALRNVEVHPYLLFRNVEAWKLLSKPR